MGYPAAAAAGGGGGGFEASVAGWVPGVGVVPAGGGLPAPWKEVKDDQGRTYFYNTVSGVSQWERPVA